MSMNSPVSTTPKELQERLSSTQDRVVNCHNGYIHVVRTTRIHAFITYITSQVDSAYHPPWDGKMSISLRAE